MKKILWFTFISLLYFCGAVFPGSPEVHSSVNSRNIDLNDGLRLTVTIEGDVDSVKQPPVNKIENFRVTGRSSSKQISIINGKMTSSKRFIYSLVPLKSGTLKIPSLEVELDGKTYKTNSIEVFVSGGRKKRKNSKENKQKGSESVFLEGKVNRNGVYLGEPVTFTIKLFTRYSISGVEIVQQPEFRNFLTEDVEVSPRSSFKTTVRNGRTYKTTTLLKKILTPIRSGRLSIKPAIMKIRIRTRSNDPFSSILNRGKTLTKRTKALKLEVKDLPRTGKPDNFNGAVGSFSLTGKLEKKNIDVNEVTTLELVLVGTGNINNITAPEYDFTPEFKAHSPEISRHVNVRGDELEGKVVLKYILTPEMKGDLKIDPVAFSFFDPQTKSYRTTKTSSFPVKVTGSKDDVSIENNVKKPITREGKDIRYIKKIGSFVNYAGSALSWNVFVLLLVIPPVLNVLIYAGYFALRTRKSKSARIRKKNAKKTAFKSLQKVDKAGSSTYTELSEILLRYIADKRLVSFRGLTTEGIKDYLKQKNVENSLVKGYISLLERLDEVRFAPESGGGGNVSEITQKAKHLIKRIDKELPE